MGRIHSRCYHLTYVITLVQMVPKINVYALKFYIYEREREREREREFYHFIRKMKIKLLINVTKYINFEDRI